MWPHSVSKIDFSCDLARGQINHQHLVSIDPRLSYPGTAVDRDKGRVPIRRNGDLMTMHSDSFLCDGRHFFRSSRIDNAYITIALIHDQQRLSMKARRNQPDTNPAQQ